MARRRRRLKRNASGRFTSARKNPSRKRRSARRNPSRRRRARRNPDAAAVSTMTFKKVSKRKARKARGSYARATPAQVAAFGSKKAKRSAAAKKAARTRKRNKAAKAAARRTSRPSRKGRARRRVSKASWNRGLLAQNRRQARSLRAKIRRTKVGKRGKRSSGVRTVLRQRLAAVNLQRRYISKHGGLSGSAKRMARAHGLMRVNPSFGAIGKDILALLPSIGAMGAAMAAVGFVGEKVQAQLATRMPTNTFITGGNSRIVVSGVLSALAYAGARMVRPLNKFASMILLGGVAVTAIQAFSKVKVDGIPLGQKLGLPIGEYVPLSGFVDVRGRQVAVNGLGDYVAMGDYVALSGNTLSNSSLGDAAGQLPSGRDANHGLGDEQSVLDFAGGEDFDGALSGSIFD